MVHCRQRLELDRFTSDSFFADVACSGFLVSCNPFLFRLRITYNVSCCNPFLFRLRITYVMNIIILVEPLFNHRLFTMGVWPSCVILLAYELSSSFLFLSFSVLWSVLVYITAFMTFHLMTGVNYNLCLMSIIMLAN